MATLQFLGATGTVTGSKYLLEHEGFRVLVDCGLIQGSVRDEARNRDPFPFDPAKAKAMLAAAGWTRLTATALTAASGVASPKDFKGKTLGVWFGGNEYPFLNWMAKLGLKTDGSAGGVKVLKQGFNVDPLLQNQAACVSTMIYNEYWQIIDAGVKPDQLVTFFYEDQGVATLEDGLYALAPKLKDPAFVAKMGKFVAASMKGWEYALKNQDEAVKIVLAADESIRTRRAVEL